MSQDNEFNYEAREVTLYEVKENVPGKDGKKATSRSLGFARTEEHAKVIVENLKNSGKISEKSALLMKKKEDPDTEASLYIMGKSVSCIFHIQNSKKISLEQYRVFTKDQQRYLTLIGESQEEEEAAAAEQE